MGRTLKGIFKLRTEMTRPTRGSARSAGIGRGMDKEMEMGGKMGWAASGKCLRSVGGSERALRRDRHAAFKLPA